MIEREGYPPAEAGEAPYYDDLAIMIAKACGTHQDCDGAHDPPDPRFAVEVLCAIHLYTSQNLPLPPELNRYLTECIERSLDAEPGDAKHTARQWAKAFNLIAPPHRPKRGSVNDRSLIRAAKAELAMRRDTPPTDAKASVQGYNSLRVVQRDYMEHAKSVEALTNGELEALITPLPTDDKK
jgi:hypothetical protein